MTNVTAVAWQLQATSATGGKNYRILLFDTYVVVGWGSWKGTMQYKVYSFTEAESAHEFALVQTGNKERGGYTLTQEPAQSHLPASSWAEDLPKFANVRGSNFSLDMAFSLIFAQGTRLAS